MAASTIAKPGSQFGPCNNLCNHPDCRASREMAAVVCPYCKAEIGYDRRFYNLDGKLLVHASCYEDFIEQERLRNLGKEPT